MFKKLLLLIPLLILFSCRKDEPEIRIKDINSPSLTSYYIRDSQAMVMGVYGTGTPDIKLGNNGNDPWASEYYFITYPNPVVVELPDFDKKPYRPFNYGPLTFVDIRCPIGTSVKVWIVQANTPLSGHTQGATTLIAGGSPVFSHNFFANYDGFNLLVIENYKSFQNLQEGYYRIYVQMGGHLLYDNLLLIKTN